MGKKVNRCDLLYATYYRWSRSCLFFITKVHVFFHEKPYKLQKKYINKTESLPLSTHLPRITALVSTLLNNNKKKIRISTCINKENYTCFSFDTNDHIICIIYSLRAFFQYNAEISSDSLFLVMATIFLHVA